MKKLNEELLRQLLLMNFDGSKTLLEQEVPKLTATGGFDTRTPEEIEKQTYKVDNAVAMQSFNDIAYEIDGGWAFWKWGTDEQGMTDAILRIKNQNQYAYLKYYLWNKYPKEYVKDASGNLPSILSFIQDQEFGIASNPYTNDLYRGVEQAAGIYGGQSIQYDFNDKFLRRMESHLQKFNTEEKYSRLGEMTPMQIILPPTASDIAHTVLPVLSVVFAWLPPASIALELADAGLYYAEGDKYSAGLGLCFAFIPAGQFFMLGRLFNKAERLVIMKKFQRECAGEIVEYSLKETKLLRTLGEATTRRLLNGQLAIKAIIGSMERTMSINMLFRMIWWLVKKGFLVANFLTQMGITIGGVFYTWDYIASLYGICGNLGGLKTLSDSEKKYLQPIGGLAKILLPFSDSACDKARGKRLILDGIKMAEKKVKPVVLERLQDIVNGNLSFSMYKNKGTKALQTLAIQLSLKNLGYTRYEKIDLKSLVPQNNRLLTTKGLTWVEKSLLDKSQPKKGPEEWQKALSDPLNHTKDKKVEPSGYDVKNLPSPVYDATGGIGAARRASGLPATGNAKLDRELSTKPLEKPTLGTVSHFNWMFYDYETDAVVRTFQKENKITPVDGIVGPVTAKKLIEKINTKSTLDGYDSGISDLTNDQITKIIADTIKQIQSENQKKLNKADLEVMVSEPQKKQTQQDMEKRFTGEVSNMEPKTFNFRNMQEQANKELNDTIPKNN